MKILFIGGTGIISSACVELASQRGHAVTLLNRGSRRAGGDTLSLIADINDADAARSTLADHVWHVIIDFTVFTVEEARSRIQLFASKCEQYVFISTASAYQKPVARYTITEETPLRNPFWEYSREKARCERLFLQASEEGQLPTTVVRPSLTYGSTHVPLIMNSWHKPFTIINRMRKGAALVSPGDGSSLWSITHSDDFAVGLIGLCGRQDAIGEAFHITTDEVLTWDQYLKITAMAAGAPPPRIIHISSDFIVSCLPHLEGSLLGDKAVSVVFDNSKIKRFVPDFKASVSFESGIEQSIRNLDADPDLQSVDAEWNRTTDTLVDVYLNAMERAKAQFS